MEVARDTGDSCGYLSVEMPLLQELYYIILCPQLLLQATSALDISFLNGNMHYQILMWGGQ